MPRLNAFIAGLVGDNSLSSAYNQAEKESEAFGKKVRNVINTFIEYKDVLIITAAVAGTIFAVSKIAAAVSATIALIRSLIVAYNALKAAAVTAAIATAFALNPIAGAAASAAIFAALGFAAKKLSDMDNANLPQGLTYNQQRELDIAASGRDSFTTGGVGGLGGGLSGGSVPSITKSTAGAATIKAAPTLIEQVSQANAEKYFMPTSTIGAGDVRRRDEAINITINGAIDPVSTARQIADILNTEASTAGSFSRLGVSRFATRVD